MKRCVDCGIQLPETEFSAHPHNHDGLMGSCKLCVHDKRVDREIRIKQREARQQEASQVVPSGYLDRHFQKRERERKLEEALAEHERVVFESPLSFAGVVEKFFRSERRRFNWGVY